MKKENKEASEELIKKIEEFEKAQEKQMKEE